MRQPDAICTILDLKERSIGKKILMLQIDLSINVVIVILWLENFES